MLLKGKTKLKVWGWLPKRDQVSEDENYGKMRCTTSCILTLRNVDLSSTWTFLVRLLKSNIKKHICQFTMFASGLAKKNFFLTVSSWFKAACKKTPKLMT